MNDITCWLKLSYAPRLGSAWVHSWDNKTAILPWLLQNKLHPQTRQYLQCQHDYAAEIAWCSKPDQHIICWDNPLFPASFKRLARPPLLLFAKGNIDLLQSRSVAIVGARKCSHFGREFARQLAEDIASYDLLVVSGMALGIDSAAHSGALERGATLAVAASGIDNIYPPQHKQLAANIQDRGLLLSPFALHAKPLRPHFLQRNVLISALSEAVVVVEAAERSGSLATARAALEQGIDVWAVPWSPGHKSGAGCLQLLSQGAGLLRDSRDLLVSLGFCPKKTSKSGGYRRGTKMQESLDQDCKLLLECINLEALPMLSLCAHTGLDAAQCLRALGLLEINGLIKAEGCGYVRI